MYAVINHGARIMTGEEFKAIRLKLGLSQAKLARLIGYSHAMMVSTFERPKNQRKISPQLALLMEALDGGFWPKSWPAKELVNDDRDIPAFLSRRTEAGDEPAADAEGSGEGTGDQRGHAERDPKGGRDSVHQHRSGPEA
jgi:transcriptional regulator with XRE-family HTH domain